MVFHAIKISSMVKNSPPSISHAIFELKNNYCTEFTFIYPYF